ncbi:phosphatase PAP2 family protein [Pseudonocardia sp. CA-107938]|uniref:phosphatase PAP2 family protein n=1 Tax=Pseudonocardia sp. CA-107938 TaxID=3240021 RepID=UPI003D8FBD5F
MPDDEPVEIGESDLEPDLDGPARVSPMRAWLVGVCVAGLVLLAGLAVWAAFVGVGPAEADTAALQDAIATRTPGLTTAAILITTVGSTVAMAVLAAAVAAALWARGRPIDAAFLVLTTASASLLFRGLKIVFDRPRPPVATRLVVETNESLPSGHATMSMIVIGALVLLSWAGRSTATRVLAVLAAVAWVGLVGATRIYLGVHWFSDVVAGWAVGAAWLTLCALLWRWWLGRSVGADPAQVSGSDGR